MSSQQKTTPCRNGCGTNIYFDNARKSASGKPIPLEEGTGQPHNCPNSTYNQNKNADKKSSALGGASLIDTVVELKAKQATLEARINELELNRWKS